MNGLLFGAIIASTLMAILSAVVLVVRSRGQATHRWLALFLVFGALWSFVVNLQNAASTEEYNLWIVRMTFVLAIMMVYSMLRFTLAVTGWPWRLRYMYGIGSVAAGLLVAAVVGWVIPSVRVLDGVIVPQRLFAYYIVIIFVLSISGYCIWLLRKVKRTTQDVIVKARLRIVTIGLSLGIVIGICTNVVLPNLLGSITPARYGWIAIALWTVILVYAVVRHQFLDIRLAAVRTVAYFLMLASMVLIYFGAAFVASSFLRTGFTNVENIIANMAIAVLLAVVFQPLRYFFDRLTNRIFYRDNYSTDDFFARISSLLGKTTDLRDLLKRAAEEIGATIKAEQSFFVMRYSNGRRISVGTSGHASLSPREVGVMNDYFVKNGGSTIVAGLLREEDVLYGILSKHKVAIVLPLMWGHETSSFLFLGNQRSRNYTKRDTHVLETIADELVIAIKNALSVQDVKEINDTLQQRIEEATKELRASNAKLRRLDEAKDEFVSMASHQLRTPLTSVKGYISMVLEGDAGKLTRMQRQLLGEAFTSSERMVHLIGDFLNVSRLQTGKFLLEVKPVNLAKVIGQEVESLQTTARAHNMKLHYRAPSYFPVLYIDESKVRQVLMNFIDNAIYYSREHTTITVKLAVEDGDAVVTVNDTGIGVPKSEQEHLFTKFFRATNARKQRPDGTGVGLFLAKKVIDAHGGSVIFESQEGEGSTFGFRLPVKKLSVAPEEAKELDNK